jgi:GNAT superfamily N-acetyltransferase
MVKQSKGPALELRALTPADWPALERLFGANGACGGCWCMYWRVKGGKAWDAAKGAPNRKAFRKLVEGGAAQGVIAYADGVPVGWCNIGPRTDFMRIAGSRVLQRSSAAQRWSVACFYVPAKWRGRGVAQRLLAAATREAFRLGAEEVEGYPKTVRSADGKAPGAFVWTGVPAMFEAAGFEPVPAEGSARVVYVKRRPGRR